MNSVFDYRVNNKPNVVIKYEVVPLDGWVGERFQGDKKRHIANVLDLPGDGSITSSASWLKFHKQIQLPHNVTF